MLSLHAAIEDIRNLIKWGMIILLVFFFGFFIYRIWPILFPPPASAPTVKFGNLPAIPFPVSESNGAFSYTLDTVSGNLPAFADRTNIYKIDLPLPNLLAVQQAKERLEAIGFEKNPTSLTDTLYQWNQTSAPFRSIKYDVLSKNFELTSSYTTDPQVISAERLETESDAKEAASVFLTALGSLPDDIDFEMTKTSLYSIENGSIVPSTSISSAQIIEVEFFQKKVNKLPIIYPYGQSLMKIMIGSSLRGPDAVEGKFSHQKVSSDYSTYPIKTAEDAYKELQNGNAFIAVANSKSDTITIKNVYLAYYIGEITQEYLLPVVVFEGDNFTAYVSAVQNNWIKK